MKSTLKRELKINNTQFALIEASEYFMITALVQISSLVTDRIGGVGCYHKPIQFSIWANLICAILYGNAIYPVGSILVTAAAQTRSYKFLVGGRVILALGDIATQVAQYKIFSSWFPPHNGFALTLGLDLGIGKIGAFRNSSAHVIAKVHPHLPHWYDQPILTFLEHW